MTLSRAQSPLEAIYREIEQALQMRLFYLAIAVTASLPDVCSALEGNVPTNWETYKKWFRENVRDRLKPFGEHECYELRCGVVHQARLMGAAKNKWSDYEALMFTLPDGRGSQVISFSMTNIGDKAKVLSMDAVNFCVTMIAAARDWERAKATDQMVQQNMGNVARVRPEGLAPYIVGIPVFA